MSSPQSAIDPDLVALHAAAEAIAGGMGTQIAEGGKQVRQLLRKKIDPNGLVGGHTALSRLLVDRGPQAMSAARQHGLDKRKTTGMEQRRIGARLDAMKALLRAGANPFLGQPNAFQLPRMAMGEHLLTALAEREVQSGRAWRDDDGSTPLHATVGNTSLNLFHFTIKGEAINQSRWLQARDNRGRTPLHRLWEDTAKDCKDGGLHAQCLMQVLLDIEACFPSGWKRFGDPADRTGDVIQILAQTDAKGHSVAHWILAVREQILARGTSDAPTLLGTAQAAEDLALLQQRTAPARGASVRARL